MYTVKLTIAYDGTGYSGWQIQKNGKTIQEEIEKAIEKVYGFRHRLLGASRTDAGVHAKGQVAHFKAKTKIPYKSIPKALNTFLPAAIVIKNAAYVKDDFHAQYQAKKKTYHYYILNEKNRDPFNERYAWRVHHDLDINLMRKEIKALLGEHDFKSFQARDKKERTSVRTIYAAKISGKRDICISLTGNGFLYNMVRNVVGTVVDIGRGYLPPDSMKNIIDAKDRTKAGPTAPPQGLVLINIKY
ncbi:MAG: tRNA pseudouridine(38-40) synthase TruA [Candidatus Omnitrophica bacterium]|nr:tRNA pseudouridine(38-40) synthase TruA [Candidatus Omnitrophota bacterium]